MELVNETLMPNYPKPWRCQGLQVWPRRTSLGPGSSVQLWGKEHHQSTGNVESPVESILSISSEIVDFQESDNLLVNEAFKMLCSLWEER